MNREVNKTARDLTAEKTGLTAAQVERALVVYHDIADALHTEPEWSAIMHTCGDKSAMAQYGSPETRVTLQVESHRGRGGKWEEHRDYVFAGKVYETYGEARAAEIASGQPVARPENVVTLKIGG